MMFGALAKIFAPAKQRHPGSTEVRGSSQESEKTGMMFRALRKPSSRLAKKPDAKPRDSPQLQGFPRSYIESLRSRC